MEPSLDHQKRFTEKLNFYKKNNRIAAILTGHTHEYTRKQKKWAGVLGHNAGTTTGKKRRVSSPVHVIDLELFTIEELTTIR